MQVPRHSQILVGRVVRCYLASQSQRDAVVDGSISKIVNLKKLYHGKVEDINDALKDINASHRPTAVVVQNYLDLCFITSQPRRALGVIRMANEKGIALHYQNFINVLEPYHGGAKLSRKEIKEVLDLAENGYGYTAEYRLLANALRLLLPLGNSSYQLATNVYQRLNPGGPISLDLKLALSHAASSKASNKALACPDLSEKPGSPPFDFAVPAFALSVPEAASMERERAVAGAETMEHATRILLSGVVDVRSCRAYFNRLEALGLSAEEFWNGYHWIRRCLAAINPFLHRTIFHHLHNLTPRLDDLTIQVYRDLRDSSPDSVEEGIFNGILSVAIQISDVGSRAALIEEVLCDMRNRKVQPSKELWVILREANQYVEVLPYCGWMNPVEIEPPDLYDMSKA